MAVRKKRRKKSKKPLMMPIVIQLTDRQVDKYLPPEMRKYGALKSIRGGRR